jgi:GTPase SAR1 family protein
MYFETSCKTGENIQDFFEQIASDLVRQYHPKLVCYYILYKNKLKNSSF